MTVEDDRTGKLGLDDSRRPFDERKILYSFLHADPPYTLVDIIRVVETNASNIYLIELCKYMGIKLDERLLDIRLTFAEFSQTSNTKDTLGKQSKHRPHIHLDTGTGFNQLNISFLPSFSAYMDSVSPEVIQELSDITEDTPSLRAVVLACWLGNEQEEHRVRELIAQVTSGESISGEYEVYSFDITFSRSPPYGDESWNPGYFVNPLKRKPGKVSYARTVIVNPDLSLELGTYFHFHPYDQIPKEEGLLDVNPIHYVGRRGMTIQTYMDVQRQESWFFGEALRQEKPE